MISGPSSCEGVAAADQEVYCLVYGVSGGDDGVYEAG